MSPDIGTPADGAARATRLPRIARKLGAITLLAVALSCVRPSEMPGVTRTHHRVAASQVALWTAPPTDDIRPAPQVALLYHARGATEDPTVLPMPKSHLLGSLVRQVV
jgi:D-alanyl-D-alanine dipeptidase